MTIQPISKGRTRAQDKARQQRLDAKARRACVNAVWERAEGLCESCNAQVYRPGSGVVWLRYGHVHEVRHRSLGGDPHDPGGCLLVFVRCHQEAHGLRVASV